MDARRDVLEAESPMWGARRERALAGALALPLLALLLAGCATGADQPAAPPPSPLTERIWDTRTERFVARDQFFAAAAAADFLLLGEIHVNPRHHAAQRATIEAVVERGRRPAVVFEMMSRDQQSGLDEAFETDGAAALVDAVAAAFEERGWDWPQYRGIVEATLASGLPVVAGNASPAETRAVVETGGEAVAAERRAALVLDQPLPPAAHSALVNVMEESHCGHALGELAGRLVEAQRLRDATMADALLAHRGEGAILITGAGHARRDYGVPLSLDARAPGARVLALALVEIVPGNDDPAAYRDRLQGLPEPYDFLWFTAREERGDPCEEFRQGLERMRRRGEETD